MEKNVDQGNEQKDDRLSTTALARKLNIPAQQLFATLKDYGWINRAGESWVLTPKGSSKAAITRTADATVAI